MKKMVVCCMLAFFLTACQHVEMNYHKQMPSFIAVNQQNEAVNERLFTHKATLVYVFFTTCATICSPMTMNMMDLQKEIEQEGISSYQLVAFTVDPSTDTPEQLNSFLQRFHAVNYGKWQFLTGYDEQFMQQFAKRAFQMIVKRDKVPTQFIHGSDLFLVDKEGLIIKRYNVGVQLPKDAIIHDLQIVAEQ